MVRESLLPYSLERIIHRAIDRGASPPPERRQWASRLAEFNSFKWFKSFETF